MTYQVQATLPYLTGLPKDVITNTFYFDWLGAGDPDATKFGNLADLVAGFYEGVFPTAGTFSMASWIDRTKYRTKIYDLVEPKPRVPKLDRTETLDVKTEANTIMPPEVAIVASYHAAPVSGVAKASLRGRIFLGGLGTNCVGVSATYPGFPIPGTALVTLIISRMQILAQTSVHPDWGMRQHSEKFGIARPVTGGWVDNALDTQRRRGNAATARTTWVP